MICFPDTSFLCSVYREQVHSKLADEFMDSLSTPLPVSTLLLFEFRNSLYFQQRLFRLDRTRGFSKAEADGMLRGLQSDLQSRALEIVPVDWADVHVIAERLSAIHTAANGHRFADILHVATALHLGMEIFLSFDDNQNKLAVAEGMAVL
jgi:predicted nucleic acid-binding protein